MTTNFDDNIRFMKMKKKIYQMLENVENQIGKAKTEEELIDIVCTECEKLMPKKEPVDSQSIFRENDLERMYKEALKEKTREWGDIPKQVFKDDLWLNERNINTSINKYYASNNTAVPFGTTTYTAANIEKTEMVSSAVEFDELTLYLRSINSRNFQLGDLDSGTYEKLFKDLATEAYRKGLIDVVANRNLERNSISVVASMRLVNPK